MDREPQFILASDTIVKTLLRKQGFNIFRDMISSESIQLIVDKYEFGFVFMMEKAHMGQSRMKLENRFKITGFVLLNTISEYELHIMLLCSDLEHKGDGNLLMESVFQYAKDNDFKIITLESLPDDKLVSWYKKLGFQTIAPIYKDDELKVFKMMLIL